MRHHPSLSIDPDPTSGRVRSRPDSTVSDIPLILNPQSANPSLLSTSPSPHTPATNSSDRGFLPSPCSSRHITPADYNRIFNSPTTPDATQSISPRSFVGVRHHRTITDSSQIQSTEHYGYYTPHQTEVLSQNRATPTTDRKIWRYCCSSTPKGSKLVKNNAVMCIISGSALAILLTIYLALVTSHEITSDAFTIVFLILIVVLTIVFIYLLIRLCLAAYPLGGQPLPESQLCAERDRERVTQHQPPFLYSFAFAPPPSSGDMPQGLQHRLAYPVRPIRVILARDEELAHLDEDEMREEHVEEDMVIGRYGNVEKKAVIRPPPPAYGLWRDSVRVDPNLLFWQRASCHCNGDNHSETQISRDTPCLQCHQRSPSSSSTSSSSSSSSSASSSLSPNTPLSHHPGQSRRHTRTSLTASDTLSLPPSPAYFDVCSPPPPPPMPAMASTVSVEASRSAVLTTVSVGDLSGVQQSPSSSSSSSHPQPHPHSPIGPSTTITISTTTPSQTPSPPFSHSAPTSSPAPVPVPVPAPTPVAVPAAAALSTNPGPSIPPTAHPPRLTLIVPSSSSSALLPSSSSSSSSPPPAYDRPFA